MLAESEGNSVVLEIHVNPAANRFARKITVKVTCGTSIFLSNSDCIVITVHDSSVICRRYCAQEADAVKCDL